MYNNIRSEFSGWGEEEPLSFLQLGSMEGVVTTHQMPHLDDALSPEILIPDGLPMGRSIFYSAYVSELLRVPDVRIESHAVMSCP